MENDCVNDFDCRYCMVGKPRDIFASIVNLMPVAFTGARAQLMLKRGAPLLSVDHTSPCDFDPGQLWWSAASVFKVSKGGPKPGPFWLSAAYDVRLQSGCASIMTELCPMLGNWNFEAVSRFIGGYLDVAVAGQVCAWNVPKTVRFDVDYKSIGRTISVSVNPILEEYSIQCLQAVSSRLLVGSELKYEKMDDRYQPSLFFKYAGPKYLFSGKCNPLAKTAKVAHYHYCSETIHTGAIIEVDAIRSTVVTRLAYRILSDSSVFRAAIGTDGIVNSLWEKRIGQRLSLSLSLFLNHEFNDSGLGIGLSFD